MHYTFVAEMVNDLKELEDQPEEYEEYKKYMSRMDMRLERVSAIPFKDFPQVIYAPNQNDRGSKYQSDVQNTRGICFYLYYHNDLG